VTRLLAESGIFCETIQKI